MLAAGLALVRQEASLMALTVLRKKQTMRRG